MRHIVIKLNFTVGYGGAYSDREVQEQFEQKGEQLIDHVAGKDKHVEVEVHDLSKTEVANRSFSHAGETAPEEPYFTTNLDAGEVPPITEAEVLELLDRKRCACGKVHLRVGDITEDQVDELRHG